jgi:hypothetical protein
VIEQVLAWFQKSDHWAGLGQGRAINICTMMVCECRGKGKTASITWVKGHEGTPGNERADVLAEKAAEKARYSKVVSLAHLKLQISEKFRKVKTAWHGEPSHHGTEEIPPPPPRSPAWTRCGTRWLVQRRKYAQDTRVP